MKKVILVVTIAVIAIHSKAQKNAAVQSQEKLPPIYSKTMKNSIAFFDENAYLPDRKAYYSEVDNEGKVVSKKIYTVALGRIIYGLSYSSKYESTNLQKAKDAAAFQINNLIGKEDAVGDYSISFIEGDKLDTSKTLDIWQQAYGLCGLTELYRNSPNKKLLTQIHRLHDAFVERYKDKKNGGFFGLYKIDSGQVSGSKTLQSLMYPITAYLGNLWLADKENRHKYEPIINENLAILYKHAWANELGWVNLKYDDYWNVCKHESAEKICFTVTPGHNFQFASLLLRTKDWDFISEADKLKYKKMGLEILSSTLQKPIFSGNNISEGFFSEVNPTTNQILDFRKTWWQHCEAMIALSLCNGKYATELEALENYFFSHFPDFKNKGDFFFLDKDNQPITTELKGAKGKSAYHTIELIRFLMENKSTQNKTGNGK